MFIQQKMQELVSEVYLQLQKLGLEYEDVLPFFGRDSSRLTKYSPELIEQVAWQIIEERKIPDNLKCFEDLCKTVDEQLDLGLDLSVFDSTPKRAFTMLKTFWAILLFVFVSYIVLCGIIDGQSALLKESHPLFSLSILLFLIVLLAALEGLQISVTTLRLKDLFLLRERFPRAFSLHKIFRSVIGTNRFLAGRQLLVIVVVFFAAQLTSFPNLDVIPYTGLRVPFWFKRVFLELGLIGAFFVLWSGQLLPQFVANKHPHGFLNLYGMKMVLKLSYWMEALELTRPGSWLSFWSPIGEYLPVSPAEKYKLEVEHIQGYGIIGLRKVWTFAQNKATLNYRSQIVFKRKGFDSVSDSSLLIRGVSPKPSFDSFLLRYPNVQDDSHDLVFDNLTEIHLTDNWRRFIQTVHPRYGSFEPNDIVIGDTEVEFTQAVKSDMIEVLRPTYYILFRLKFLGSRSEIHPKVTVYRNDDQIGNPKLLKSVDLSLHKDSKDNFYAEFIEFYPETDTSYILTWDVEH